MNDSIQIQKINQKLELLQSKIDSLGQSATLKQLEFKLNEKQDVISQVNDFYDSAWLKLIIIISILGIVIPLMAQYFQRKNLKELTTFIQNQMNNNFETKLKELKSFNKLEMEKSLIEFKDNIKDLENKNELLNSQVEASLFFLQGQQTFKSKKYASSAKDFIISSYYWLKTDRTSRIEITVSNITKVLTKVNSIEELDELNEKLNLTLKMNLDEFITHCKKHSHYNLIETHLDDIELEIERIKNVA
jgi:Tfp pilus assembly major pilin PilA